ncbi:MAG: alpha/beta fold hydrolase, partial [Acidimicrobiales bacterium]
MTQSQYIEMPWGRIAYRRTGSGDPLLLLHSLALSGRMWEPVLGAFTPTHDVLTVDLRGHGDSSYDRKPFCAADMCDDLVRLLDELNLARTHVLGLSMGGSIASVFASVHPDRIDRLVLCDTTAWYGPDARSTWAERAATALSKPRAMLVPFQIDRWFSDRFRRTRPEVVVAVVRIFLRTASRAHADACLMLGEVDARDGLGAVQAPTLIVTGEEDYATPPSMGQILHEGIASSTMQVWPGLRHFAILE